MVHHIYIKHVVENRTLHAPSLTKKLDYALERRKNRGTTRINIHSSGFLPYGSKIAKPLILFFEHTLSLWIATTVVVAVSIL